MSMSAALAAGITATSAAIGQAASINATNNLNRRNRQWQESMWNKTNAYNTPLAQKERLEEAGINPYAVLAQGGSDTGQSSMASSPQQEVPDFSATSNLGSNILGAINMSKQNELLDQQKEAGNINLEFQRVEKIANLQKMYAETGTLLEQKNLSHAEREMLEKRYFLLGETMDALIRKEYAEAKHSEIDTANLQYNYELSQALQRVQARLALSHIGVNNKEIEKLQSDIVTNGKIQSYYGSLVDLNYQQIDNLVDEIRNNVRNRVSSRLRDKREADKVEAEIVVSILGTLMDANSKQFGALGKFRTVQGKVVNVLKKQYPHLVNTDIFDELVYGLEDPEIHTPQHGGVR